MSAGKKSAATGRRPQPWVTADPAILSHRLRLQEALGAAFRKRRLAREMTQADVAARAGTHRPIVTRVERGRHELSLGTLVRYACALGCPLAELVREAEALVDAQKALARSDAVAPRTRTQLDLPNLWSDGREQACLGAQTASCR